MPYPAAWDVVKAQFTPFAGPYLAQYPIWRDVTFVFDHVCHSLVGVGPLARMANTGNFPELPPGDPRRLTYFAAFFDPAHNYTEHVPDTERLTMFRVADAIHAHGLAAVPDQDVRDFCAGAHAVNRDINPYGRATVQHGAPVAYLRGFLEYIIMPGDYDLRFGLALNHLRSRRGANLAESFVGEFFGWLYPALYPIYNDKFSRALAHLGCRAPHQDGTLTQ